MKKFFTNKKTTAKKVPYWEQDTHGSTTGRPDKVHFDQYNSGNFTSSTFERPVHNLSRNGSCESSERSVSRESSFDRIVPQQDGPLFNSSFNGSHAPSELSGSDTDSLHSRQTSNSSQFSDGRRSGMNSPQREWRGGMNSPQREWYPRQTHSPYSPSTYSEYSGSVMSYNSNSSASSTSSKKTKSGKEAKIKMKNGWPTLETPESKKREKQERKLEKRLRKKQTSVEKSDPPAIIMRDIPQHSYKRIDEDERAELIEESQGDFFFTCKIVDRSEQSQEASPLNEKRYSDNVESDTDIKCAPDNDEKPSFFFDIQNLATSELELLEMGKRATENTQSRDDDNWTLNSSSDKVTEKRPDFNKRVSEDGTDPGYQTIEEIQEELTNLEVKTYDVTKHENPNCQDLYAKVNKRPVELKKQPVDEDNYVTLPLNRKSIGASQISEADEHNLMSEFNHVIEFGEETLQRERKWNESQKPAAVKDEQTFFFGFGSSEQQLEPISEQPTDTKSKTDRSNEHDEFESDSYSTMVVHADKVTRCPDMDASSERRKEKLKELFRISRDIDSYEIKTGDENENLLMIAASSAEVSWTEMLLKMGAKVNKTHPMNGCTPLHYAVTAESPSSPEIVRMLLEAGADPDLLNSGGEAAIHRAIMHQGIECVHKLITVGKCDVNLLWKEGGVRPLNLAVQSGTPELVRMLLDAGARVNVTDIVSTTAPTPRTRGPLRQLLHSWRGNDQKYIAILKILLQADAFAGEQFKTDRNHLRSLLIKSCDSAEHNQTALLELVTSVVLMGYEPSDSEMQLIASIDPRKFDWVKEYTRQPPSLHDLANNNIRKAFSTNVIHGVRGLNISQDRKDDILFNQQSTEL